MNNAFRCTEAKPCANGLFSGLDRHLTLPKGYYSALHILCVLCVLGFMALARIRRPEQLRHHPPGALGKAPGLDRVPEVCTLREKSPAWPPLSSDNYEIEQRRLAAEAALLRERLILGLRKIAG